MTLNAKRKRVHDKLAAMPGVRTVRRPVTPGGTERFDLFHVRTGPLSAHPVVVIPGGPGVASVQLYKGLRRHAAARRLDVMMIEHRGVGLSRHDDTGADLPPEAITVDQVVDDIAAVLDDAGIDTAVMYGTSYGSYLAAGFGVRHPERVRAMVLDSPVLSARDIGAVRAAIRGLLLGGPLAPKVRRLIADGVMTPSAAHIATMSYGIGGAGLLDRQLDLLLSGHTLLWRAMERVGRVAARKVPYRNEMDLVGRIAFRELDYIGEPDGLPFDPSEAMRQMADQIPGPTPDFESEPYDLVREMPGFDWPTVVISGGRDLITPPVVAREVASLIPGATLVGLPSAGHSVLDTRERAALRIVRAVARGDIASLPSRTAELDELPVNPALRLLFSWVGAAASVERKLPLRA
jgi:pimeloyl-ACP methyl ester carboxylesterase